MSVRAQIHGSTAATLMVTRLVLPVGSGPKTIAFRYFGPRAEMLPNPPPWSGRLELVAPDRRGGLIHSWQLTRNGIWNPWQWMGVFRSCGPRRVDEAVNIVPSFWRQPVACSGCGRTQNVATPADRGDRRSGLAAETTEG